MGTPPAYSFLISLMIEVQLFGSPGPFDSMIPSGIFSNISSAAVSAGYTVTSHPRLDSEFTILSFSPRLRIATRTPSPGIVYFSLHVTCVTAFTILYSLTSEMIFTRSYSGSVVIIPFMVPFSRSLFVSDRVSIPVIPVISCCFRNSCNVPSHRKLLGVSASSLTIYPFAHPLADSISGVIP